MLSPSPPHSPRAVLPLYDAVTELTHVYTVSGVSSLHSAATEHFPPLYSAVTDVSHLYTAR